MYNEKAAALNLRQLSVIVQDVFSEGGLAHLGVTLSDDGAIKHHNNLHVMMFGARDGKQNSTAEELLSAFAPDESQMALYRQKLIEPGSPSKASMLRDIERGAQTEVEHIIGDMVSKAARHRISAPVLKTAYTHLQAYEADRCASSP